MKLIVGLGNPGQKYVNTRHNAGSIFVDELQSQISKSKNQAPNKSKILIFKSQNFMNESGNFVSKLCTKYSVLGTDLYIVHDDLDILLGEYKIQFGKGPRDHNGLKSIDDSLGTDQYWHVRIGVDNRSPDNRPMGIEYVLQNFSDEEKTTLERVIKEACRELISKFQIPNFK